MQIQSVLPELAIEAFNNGIPGRFARLDEMQFHTALSRPEEHRFAGQFGSVVADNGIE